MLEPFLCSLCLVFETILVLKRGVSLTLTWLIIKHDWLYVSPLPFSRLTQRPCGHSLEKLQDSVGLDGVVDTPGHDTHNEQENQEDDPEGSLLIEPVQKSLVLREDVSVQQGGDSHVLVLSQLCRAAAVATGHPAAASDACNAITSQKEYRILFYPEFLIFAYYFLLGHIATL